MTSTDGNAVTDVDTVTITVSPVNDAPTITALADQVIPEDGTTGALPFTVSDVETAAGSLTVTAASSNTTIIPNGNLTLVDLGGGNWTIAATPALNQNGGPVTITVTVSDGTTTTNETFDVTVSPVNDAPVNTVPGAQVVNEDTALALGGISVNDVDGNLSTVQLGVTQGTVTVNLAGGATISSGANGTATLTLAGTQAQINAALGTLVYQGTLNYNGPDMLTVTSTDGNAVTDVDTVTITVSPVNDAPTITALADQVIPEDGTTGALPFTVSDVETAAGSLTVTAASSNTTIIPNGNLTLVDLGGGNWTIAATPALNQNGGPVTITVTVSDGTTTTNETFDVTVSPVNDAPTVTALADQVIPEDGTTGALPFTVSDVETAAGSLTVTAASSNTTIIPNGNLTLVDLGGGNWTIAATPALNQNGGPVTITVTVSDGTTTTNETFDVTVSPVNDAPVNTVPGAQVVNEDTALALGGISVNDVDGNLSTVQLGVTQGTVTVNLAGGATISSGANGTATLTLAGTQAQINAALGTLVYQGTLNYNGPDMLTVTSTDGNAVTDVDTVTITVGPVNDAPSLATNAGSTVVQGLTDLITSGELHVIDADNTPGQLTYTVTTAPVNGRLELTTAPGVAITNFTQADINAGRLVFVHSGAVSTNDSFIFTVSDGAGGTIGATTFSFTVTPFAPPPPPPPPPPGPGPVPVPIPVPGPTGLPPSGVVPPVLPPPPVLVTVVGATDEPARKMAVSARTFARVEQPEIVPEEPAALPLEPLSLPVKTMLAMGHKLAEHLTRLADDLERVKQEREQQAHLVGRVASFSGIALSVGFVAWILRGGSLLASFLVSMPAWRHFDPLPVLGSGTRDRRKRDRKAREEHELESKQFRGLDEVLKSSEKPAKQKKTGHVRRPKS